MPLPLMQRERRSGMHDPAFLLALIYTAGFYAFVMSTVLINIPADNKDLVGQLLPVLSMIQGGIVQYFYTKSQQAASERKDEALGKLADATKAAALSAPPSALVENFGLKSGVTANVENMNVSADNVALTEDKGKKV